MSALVASSARAADPEFYATVDRDEVSLGDVVTLQVTVSITDDPGDIKLPEAPDFDVVSRSQSEQMSFAFGTGGAASFRKVRVYNVVLSPRRVGAYTIKPGRLVVVGKTFETGALKVRVVAAGQLPPRRQQRQAPRPVPQPLPSPFHGFPGLSGEPDEDPFSQLFGGGSLRPQRESDLFVKVVVDRSRVFVGEQTTMTVYLFSRVEVTQVEGLKMPKLDGFWAEDLDTPSQIVGETKVVEGIPYRVYVLRRRALFPTRAGKLAIDPVEVDVATGLSALFGGERAHRASQAEAVTVLPLPPGAPLGFESVNVGQWKLSADARPLRTTTGQPVTFVVAVEGTGNVRNLLVPKPPPVAGLKIFDPTATEKPQTGRGRYGGRRTLEYLVVPERTGQFTLPALEMAYFDPASQSYEVTRTSPITFAVEPGLGIAPSPGVPATEKVGGQNVLTATGLRPVRFAGAVVRRGAPPYRQPAFLGALAVPWLLWLVLVAAESVRAAVSSEDASARRRRAASRARRRLKRAAQLARAGNADAFYAEVARVLTDYLGDKLGSSVTGLTRAELAERLEAMGAGAAVVAVNRTLDACDAGRFAPGGSAAATLKQVLQSALEAMESMESHRPAKLTPQAATGQTTRA